MCRTYSTRECGHELVLLKRVNDIKTHLHTLQQKTIDLFRINTHLQQSIKNILDTLFISSFSSMLSPIGMFKRNKMCSVFLDRMNKSIMIGSNF